MTLFFFQFFCFVWVMPLLLVAAQPFLCFSHLLFLSLKSQDSQIVPFFFLFSNLWSLIPIPGSSGPHRSTPSPLPCPHFFLFNPFLMFFFNCFLPHFFRFWSISFNFFYFFSVASVNYCSGSSFWSALIVLRNFQFSGFMQLVVNELVLLVMLVLLIC